MALLQVCSSVRSVAALDADCAGPTVLEVAHEGDEWAIAELVSVLAKAQIPLGAVEPERTDFERIFMDVTQAARDGSARPTGAH